MTISRRHNLDIAHLGNLELFTPRPAESQWYFRDVLGMEIVHQQGQSAYLRGYGDYAVSTLKLTEAPQPGIGTVSFRAVSPEALENRVKALEAAGLGEGWSDGDYGRGDTYYFRDPDGHRMAIYFDEEHYQAPPDLQSTLKNQPMKYLGRGVGVKRIDHLAMMCKEVEPNRNFAQELLGMQLREQVLLEDDSFLLGSWLSNTVVHHELAYVADATGSHGRLHHISLWVDNREDVLRAADILRENHVFIEAGPSKHNNSQAFYLYSYEPGGNRVEVYSCGLQVFSPEWEVINWNEEEREGGVYWGGKLPESFATYATPPVTEAQTAAARKLPVIDAA